VAGEDGVGPEVLDEETRHKDDGERGGEGEEVGGFVAFFEALEQGQLHAGVRDGGRRRCRCSGEHRVLVVEGLDGR
jgi:hypothetical protein